MEVSTIFYFFAFLIHYIYTLKIYNINKKLFLFFSFLLFSRSHPSHPLPADSEKTLEPMQSASLHQRNTGECRRREERVSYFWQALWVDKRKWVFKWGTSEQCAYPLNVPSPISPCRMQLLLEKFRLGVKDVVVLTDIDQKPHPKK